MTYRQLPARSERPSPAWLFLPMLTVLVLVVIVAIAVATAAPPVHPETSAPGLLAGTLRLT